MLTKVFTTSNIVARIAFYFLECGSVWNYIYTYIYNIEK